MTQPGNRSGRGEVGGAFRPILPHLPHLPDLQRALVSRMGCCASLRGEVGRLRSGGEIVNDCARLPALPNLPHLSIYYIYYCGEQRGHGYTELTPPSGQGRSVTRRFGVSS